MTISINDWLAFKYFLCQLDSTLLLNCFLYDIIIETSSSSTYWRWFSYCDIRTFSMMAAFHISINDRLAFKYFLYRQLDSTLLPFQHDFFSPLLKIILISRVIYAHFLKWFPTFHISISDWLPLKYFLRQLDSTLLLPSYDIWLRRHLLPHNVKDDSHIDDDICTHFLKWFPN